MGVFIKQHALKGQKLIAQGNALGIKAISKAPCKGKSFTNCPWSFKAFALTGRQVTAPNNPGRCPGLRASALSGRATCRSFWAFQGVLLMDVWSGLDLSPFLQGICLNSSATAGSDNSLTPLTPEIKHSTFIKKCIAISRMSIS